MTPSTVIVRPGTGDRPVELVVDGDKVFALTDELAKEVMAALACDLRWRLGRKGPPQLPLAQCRRPIEEGHALTLIADIATKLRQARKS